MIAHTLKDETKQTAVFSTSQQAEIQQEQININKEQADMADPLVMTERMYGDFLVINEADDAQIEQEAPQATVHKRSTSEKKQDDKNLSQKKKLIKAKADREIEALKQGDYTEKDIRDIEIEKYRLQINMYDEQIQDAIQRNLEKKDIDKLYRAKEKADLKMHSRMKLNKIEAIENPAEREREMATYKRHKWFDLAKKFLYTPSKYAIEGAVYEDKSRNLRLVNKGRAHFGGTKPMYIFEDENGRKYLYKEGVNCVGKKKTQGALVTEAASKLQEFVCGEDSITAFVARGGENVVGSFQLMIDQMSEEDGRVDLFKWQANPDNSLSDKIKGQVLREHTLDWLLCNFDTKGENFLHKPNGNLSSFDKEASFSFIMDEGAQHMSTTYRPHSNDTVYNVMFDSYIKGKLDLDFTQTKERAQEIQDSDDATYIGYFEEMLRTKYTDKAKYNEVKERILARKKNLVAEYNAFIDKLQAQRRENSQKKASQKPAA